MVIVSSYEITEPATAEESMQLLKLVDLLPLTGYEPVSDEAVTLDGLPAAKHEYRYIEVTEGGSYQMSSVVYVVRRGDNVVVMGLTVERAAYARLLPTLDRIAKGLVVR